MHHAALGVLGPGPDAEAIRREVTAAGNARVAIGFITWRLDRNPAALEAVLATGPVAIMLSFGNSAAYFPRIKAAGAKIICQVQTLAMAREAAAAGRTSSLPRAAMLADTVAARAEHSASSPPW